MNEDLLIVSLEVAVPLWIDRMKQAPWAEIELSLPRCAEVIANRGDIILFKSQKRGETAAAFNVLAQALAALSFMPGGVKAFRQHWETKHPELT